VLALAGCAPHENSTVVKDGRLQVDGLLKAIAESETPLPREFNIDVPSDLEAICLKAMSRKQQSTKRTFPATSAPDSSPLCR
jgi:hypothetical protein